jgi:hypothetical protein
VERNSEETEIRFFLFLNFADWNFLHVYRGRRKRCVWILFQFFREDEFFSGYFSIFLFFFN